jgi:hypothetical protein
MGPKAAVKSKVVKAGSPKKASKPPSMRDNLKARKEKSVPTISVQGFHVVPLAAEAYKYTITNLKNGYVNEFRKYAKGEITSDELTNANFVGLKTKQYRGTGNEPLLDPDGYLRVWILQYPLEGESTAETRQEGLRVLKDFFMSKKATNYPPNSIAVVDHTTDDVPVLEDYFMDNDIEEIVKLSCDADEINMQFYENYPEFASKIYSKQEPSTFAKDTLGFPSILEE